VIFELSKNSRDAENDLISVKLIIKGRVQGVYYRVNMQKVAKENFVVGWVRNLPDGNVEALLEGNRANVNHVVQWSNIGPENAKVDAVIVDFKEYTGKYGDFLIRHDEA
jgi:acylphosphatase